MHVTMSLFESLIVLAIGGVFAVAWWGVKRIVKTNDEEAKTLKDINTNLKDMCERLASGDTWMLMHSRQDDERHEENKEVLKGLKKSVDDLNARRS